MKTLVVGNNKGGVGKTTLVANIAGALAEKGKRSLLLDMDPQASLSEYYGDRIVDKDKTIYTVLTNGLRIQDVICKVNDMVSLIPSQLELVDLEIEGEEDLVGRLRRVKELDGFDYVIVDTPPSLGSLLFSSLLIGDYVVVPIQAEYLPVRGWAILERVIRLAKKENKNLRTLGLVVSMYDKRLVHAREMLHHMKSELSGKVHIFHNVIPRYVDITEAAVYGEDVLTTESKSKSAEAYRNVAREILTTLDERRKV